MRDLAMSSNTMYASPAPVEEEVAGPPVLVNPTQANERVSSIDVLRGFALLGILVLNIDDFGTTLGTHDIPIATPTPSFSGPHAHLNLALLLIKWMFFESKMRGIFSMLFGAGVILLTTRAEKRGAAAEAADVYTRRNMLLTLFGLIHGILIWSGDILFDYGFQALLFLYPARKLKARTLIILGTLVTVIVGSLGVMVFTNAWHELTLNRQVAKVELRQQQHQPLSASDLALEKQWQATVQRHRISPEKIRERLKAGRAGYGEQVKENAGRYFGPEAFLHIAVFGDTVGAMLLGMGLFKIGFLRAQSSTRTYVLTALLGFAVSLPLYAYGIFRCYATGFSFISLDEWVWLPFEFTRMGGMLAMASVVLLIVKHNLFRAPQRWLASVGKTAFTNYIGTSLICQFLFVWSPLQLYGKLEYCQLMYVTTAVWTLNRVASSLWLRYFAFGPLEWLWRSLTYGKRQPMRLPAAAAVVA